MRVQKKKHIDNRLLAEPPETSVIRVGGTGIQICSCTANQTTDPSGKQWLCNPT